MSNVNPQHAKYFDRLRNLEQERRNLSEDTKGIKTEMRNAGLTPAELKGIALAVRRSFETNEQQEARESAEQVAAALGDFADTDLGRAAAAAA